jgi:acyl-CoA synthetase (AMP-forming)/AMP-acid ligase II
VGRLFIRSTSMMAGYLGREGIDTSVLDGGWFQTGDLATRDQRGLCLKGRHSEVINVGGLKVIPCEVEDVIAALPGIHEVKVYAGQDRSGRQFVKAAIVGAAELSPVEIEAHCERELVYYKRPRVVLRLDKLPRTASGKIIARELP